ncbi:MAG: hypothetical protein OXP36_06045 [Gammaproteobacteria bacterium]|nr:hypothetical protein [Gammaproteobacteria bacterium]
MAKLIVAFVIGLGLGAGVVVLVMNLTGAPEPLSPAPPTIETSPNAASATRPQAPSSQPKSLAAIQSLPSEFERSTALYTRLQSADMGTLEILLDEAEELTDPGRFKEVIYSRYVQLDPRAALDRLRGEEGDQQTLVRTTVSAVASLDLDAALAFLDTFDKPLQSVRDILGLDGLSDARKEEVATRFGLEPHLRRLQGISLAKSDAAGAWQTALAIEKNAERLEMMHSVANTWFETDPSAALSALASVDTQQTGSWKAQLLRRWVNQDPDAALQWAIEQPGSDQRDPLRLVAGVVARHSPQAMFELAETLEPGRRDMVAEMVLHAWGRADPVAALDGLAVIDSAQLRNRVAASIVRSWANDDPRAAFDWVRTEAPSPMRSSMLSSTLGNLGKSDPLRALSLADELDGTVRSTAIEQVLRVWGREDPRSAAAWLDSSQDTTPTAVSAVARHYAEVDAEAAFEWVQDQSVEAQRRAVTTVVGRIAAGSPESALRLVNRIRDSQAKLAAEYQVIKTWADTDPRAAVRAIARMDDSPSQHLYQSTFRSWSLNDPEGATAFLDHIPPSDRDHAILGMLQPMTYGSADLERLFDRMTDDEMRRRAAGVLFARLREVDPKRAERFRELSGATEHRSINVRR